MQIHSRDYSILTLIERDCHLFNKIDRDNSIFEGILK